MITLAFIAVSLISAYISYRFVLTGKLNSLFKHSLYFFLILILQTSTLLLILYYLNAFSITNLLIISIILAVVLFILALVLKVNLIHFTKPQKLISKYDLVLLLILLFLLVPLSQTSYFGLISQTDSFAYIHSAEKILDQTTHDEILPSIEGIMLPFPASSELPLFPSWIALFASMFSLKEIFLINSFFLYSALIAIYLFACIYFNEKVAILSVFLLSINLGELLTAKTVLREIPSQFMLFASLVFLAEKRLPNILITSLGFLLGLFMRPEFLIIFPLLIFILIFNTTKQIIILSITSLFSIILFLYLTVIIAPVRYFSLDFIEPFLARWNSPVNIFLLVLVIPSLVLFFIIRKHINLFINSRHFAILTLSFLAIVFIYFDYISPVYFYNNPYFSPDITRIMIAGEPNFDTISLERFGYFVPLIVVILPMYAVYSLLTQKDRKVPLGLQIFLLLLLAQSILTFYNPSHEPNIRLWIRRFVPIIIPGILLLSSVGIDKLRFNKRLEVLIIGLITIISLAIYVPTSLVAEYSPLYDQLNNYSQSISKDDAVLFNMPKDLRSDFKVAGSLKLLFDKKVYSIEDPNLLPKETIERLKTENSAVYLVSTFPISVSECNRLVEKRDLSFKRLNWEFFRYPSNVVTVNFPLYKYTCN